MTDGHLVASEDVAVWVLRCCSVAATTTQLPTVASVSLPVRWRNKECASPVSKKKGGGGGYYSFEKPFQDRIASMG